MNLPLDTSPKINRKTRHNNSNAKQQLGLATTKINNKNKAPIKSIDFDLTKLTSEQEHQYFFENLPDTIYKLLDNIDFNNEHWMIYYEYDNHWKSRTLDDTTEQYLRDQVKHDLQEHLYDFFEYGADYDFFPVAIQSLNKMRFVNIDNSPLINSKNQELKPVKRKKREGKFWRWFLKGFPEIDLSKFMIFHKLDKSAVQLINRDNCFVYACQQAGLSDELLNELR